MNNRNNKLGGRRYSTQIIDCQPFLQTKTGEKIPNPHAGERVVIIHRLTQGDVKGVIGTERRDVIPLGTRKYHFNADAKYAGFKTDSTVFSTVAINEKNALRKFKNNSLCI